jgi:hypothetical protein
MAEKENEYEYKTTGNDHEWVERYDYRVQISYKADRITFGFDGTKEYMYICWLFRNERNKIKKTKSGVMVI